MFRLGTPSPELSRVPSPASSSRDSITHADRVPLLQDDARADWSLAAREGSEDDDPQTTKVGKWAITCLLLQHVSSTFGDGSYNFAAFLFLIEVYRDTLVPASLVGFCTTCAGLILSSYIGGLVDRMPRLEFVRGAVGAQKTLQALNYGLFLFLFGPLREAASDAFHGRADATTVVAVWTILLLTIVCSSCLGLANTGLTVAVERDWVATIAAGDSALLTRLNTSIRRIDLTAKLCAPLVVSFFTTVWGYTTATAILLSLSLLTLASEYLWVGVVYSHFRSLAVQTTAQADTQDQQRRNETWGDWLSHERDDWAEFVRLPIFGSSVAIATIYLTTLSYDGTFIAYVKAARGWDDGFVAVMRGVCVLTGLLGTAVMPLLESHMGLERAGAWSIWFEAACLLPSLVSFFYGTGQYGEHGPAWNSTLLFGGIALSRIGLWSFDLCQLKVLQLATEHHPRRNRLAALQIALQNLFNLAKYVVTLAAATPAHFKWTALVSYAAVVGGAVAYAYYLRAVRGHLLHLDWFRQKLC